MKGYIRNESNEAYFVLQRQIPPGGKVQLDDVYKTVGKKSGLAKGPEFIAWLDESVLTRGTWSFYEADDKLLQTKTKTKKVNTKKKSTSSKTSSNTKSDAKGAGRVLRRDSTNDKGKEITPSTILEAPYEQARSIIEKCADKSVLRKALNGSKHFSGKEKHMRHLMKRLEQVY